MAAEKLVEEVVEKTSEIGVELTPAGTLSAKEELALAREVLKKKAGEIAELQAERDVANRRSADLAASLRDVPQLQWQLAEMKAKIESLGQIVEKHDDIVRERDHLVREVGALRGPSVVQHIGKLGGKAIEPFVEAVCGVGDAAKWVGGKVVRGPGWAWSGIKLIPESIIILLLAAIRAPGYLVALPTVACAIWCARGRRSELSFVLAMLSVVLAFMCASSSLFDEEFIFAQLWCFAHGIDLTAVLRAMGWTAIATNLASLSRECHRANKLKNATVQQEEKTPASVPNFLRDTGEFTVQIPALPRPTLEQLQAEDPWIRRIERDCSPTQAVTMKLATVLGVGETSSISGAEYERRLAPHLADLHGYQQLKWLVAHQDEHLAFRALLGKIYLDGHGIVVVHESGDWRFPYLARLGERFELRWGSIGVGFYSYGRIASSSK